MYTLKVSYIIKYKHTYIYFKSVPYDQAKTYLYIFQKGFVQFKINQDKSPKQLGKNLKIN